MVNLTKLKLSRSILLILLVLILIVGGRYWWWQREQRTKGIRPPTEHVFTEVVSRFGGKIEEIWSGYLVVNDPAEDAKEKFFFSPDVPIRQITHFIPKDVFSGTIKPSEEIESVPLKTLEKNDDVVVFYTETTEGKLVIQRIELVKFKRE